LRDKRRAEQVGKANAGRACTEEQVFLVLKLRAFAITGQSSYPLNSENLSPFGTFATGGFPQGIRFVLVNNRVPRTDERCALCGGFIQCRYFMSLTICANRASRLRNMERYLFDILLALIERAGELVTKQELARA
jgi:hypothetical protein